MSDYFGGQSREELEALLRRVITQGPEGSKLDFKRTIDLDSNSARAELAKDVASIANTDDPQRFNDVGYIVLGAERGRIVGCPVLSSDSDKLQARMTDLLKNYLSPLPHFSLAVYSDPVAGAWGAIVIPPSMQQPHVHARDGGTAFARHDWFVRVNDTTDRAGSQDYTRLLEKAVRRQVQPLEAQMQRLAHQVAQRDAGSIESLLAAVGGHVAAQLSKPNDQAIAIGGGDISSRIRGRLVRGDRAIEDALEAEAMRLWAVVTERSDINPWSFGDRSPMERRKTLVYLEEASAPLAMALATIARFDRSGRYTGSACRALSIIARQPSPSGAYSDEMVALRLYPLALCLYAVVTISTVEQRADLIKSVLALELEDGDCSEPIVFTLRRVRAAHELFNTTLEGRWCEPIPLRVRDEFIPRLSSLLTRTTGSDAFRLAEFVLALASLRDSVLRSTEGYPMRGLYLYEHEARRALGRFLSRRPDWISDALGAPLTKLLTAFDANAYKVVNPSGSPDGFVRGAQKAYGEQS